MRVRHDIVLISSILFTIALLWLVPPEYAEAFSNPRNLTTTDPWVRQVSRDHHWFGIAALATIAICLIVIWTGYVRASRSAWFIMCVFVWGWVFPVMIWPFDLRGIVTNIPEFVRAAIKEPGLSRGVAEQILIFLLMLTALLLPIRAFFPRRTAPTQ